MELLQTSFPTRTRPTTKSKGYRRTFTGCWNCRSRRVKCDEKVPSCTPCVKSGKICSGYQQSLVWVTSEKSYKPNRRRFLDPGRTWSTHTILNSEDIDDLIQACDDDDIDTHPSPTLRSPFSVFKCCTDCDEEQSERELSIGLEVETDLDAFNHELPSEDAVLDILSPPTFTMDFETYRSPSPPTSIISLCQPSLLGSSMQTQMNPSHAYLFQYYVNQVAPILMPTHDATNPWSRYPAIALHQSFNGEAHLLHAMMAHAAIVLANTSDDKAQLFELSTRYYMMAMQELRHHISGGQIDYVGLLTTTLTLTLIELFQGNSKTWRHHYTAAWKFLQQQRNFQLWSSSEDAWYATQSFYLLRIKSETSLSLDDGLLLPNESDVESDEDVPLEYFSTNPLFGHTMGSSSSIMACIADINKIAQQRWSQGIALSSGIVPIDILQRLKECHKASKIEATDGTSPVDYASDTRLINGNDYGGRLHRWAFAAGALIYFYQTFYELPPDDLSPYVSEVLTAIEAFDKLYGANYTFWPAFIAAVEVYEECDMIKFTNLLDRACNIGMANRFKIKLLVEKVWQKRAQRAEQSGQAQSMIKIDWREVMRGLGVDILLV